MSTFWTLWSLKSESEPNFSFPRIPSVDCFSKCETVGLDIIYRTVFIHVIRDIEVVSSNLQLGMYQSSELIKYVLIN